MTVKELKQLLESVPDDYEVQVTLDDDATGEMRTSCGVYDSCIDEYGGGMESDTFRLLGLLARENRSN